MDTKRFYSNVNIQAQLILYRYSYYFYSKLRNYVTLLINESRRETTFYSIKKKLK